MPALRANTVFNGLQGTSSNSGIMFDGAPTVRLVVDSNAFGHGDYGVKGSGQADGNSTLAAYAPGGKFTNNAIVGGCGPYPATNTCPATMPTTGAGANLAAIAKATSGVVVADTRALRRAVARRAQLKYVRPEPNPECQKSKPALVCTDPPLGLR